MSLPESLPDQAAPPVVPEWVGHGRSIFWLALKTTVLTVVTLGIYRFWMKTRVRRWFWSSIRVEDAPLEYAGDPFEKLTGFLMAVVVMAFYFGVVNLVLVVVSFAWLSNTVVPYALTAAAVVPVVFYALYRARRYRLARTRWRGIRFGVEKGAWGYAGRGVLHLVIAVLTLGLLWPRMSFLLEKYRTDRTDFGDIPFVQTGRWQMLFGPFLLLWLALVAAAVGGFGLALEQDWGGLVFGLGLVASPVALANYRAARFGRMVSHKHLGDARFVSQPGRWRVLWIMLSGLLIPAVLASAPLLVVVAVLLGLLVALYPSFGIDLGAWELQLGEGVGVWDAMNQLASPWVIAGVLLCYFLAFSLWRTARLRFYSMPLWRHYASTLRIETLSALDQAKQRSRDEFVEAEGFADALDLGSVL